MSLFPDLKLSKFSREDKIKDFISLMGNNMILTAIAIGEKYTYFISDHFNVIENERIEEGTLSNSTNDSLDPFDYHIAKCGEGAFKTMECNQIHNFYPNEDAEQNDDEEDIWRAQRQIEVWVEEQRNLDEPG